MKNPVKISPCIYDNCKDCTRSCEHAGKDREFVCPNGVTCKVTHSPADNERAAAVFIGAIRTIASKPENLANLEFYLSHHFASWIKNFASTPADMAAEMKNFAEMEL